MKNGKSRKSSIFKYFEPVDIFGAIQDGSPDQHTIDEGLGYFAFSPQKKQLFLNRLSVNEILDIAKKVGLTDHLASRGFEELRVEIERDETMIHYLKIYDRDVSPVNLLIDLRLSESRFIPDEKLFISKRGTTTLDMIVIEWLSAENPKNRFDPTKPLLPGQKKPGLGCLNFLMEMMYIVGKAVIKDGFMDIPDHMHGAIMYSRKFQFFDPVQEAILRAIIRDMEGYSLQDITWGMITGNILDKATGLPQPYKPAEQIYTLSGRLKKYFNSSTYKNRFKEVYKKKQYIFNYEQMIEKRNEILKNKELVDI